MEADNSTPQASSTTKLPSAFKLVSPSIDALSANFWTFAGLFVFEMFFLVILYILMLANSDPNGTASVSSAVAISMTVLGVLGGVCALIAEPALTKTQLVSTKDQKVGFSAAFKSGLPFVWRLLGLQIMMGLISIVAIVLLIIPFFFVYPRILLAPYYLIDRNLSIMQALKTSAAEYKKVKGVWGLIGVQFLFSIVPFANIILGILYYCAPAVRYQQITAAASGKTDATEDRSGDISEVLGPKDSATPAQS